MAAISPAATDAARRRIRFAGLLVLLIGLFGVFAVDFLVGEGFVQPLPSSGNIFFRLYGLHEGPFFWLLIAFALAAWALAGRVGVPTAPTRPKPIPGAFAVTAVAAAVAVFLVTLAGKYWILHSTPLSMDEYAAAFQARILASGKFAAPVPAEWQPFAGGLVPLFIVYRAAEQTWLSSYLPAYAALLAPFTLVKLEILLNPLLAAVSVLSLAGASARLWPGDVRRARLALLFFVTSAQFLLMSMTGYAWAAHLAFNLLWLYLVLRDDRLGLAAAPWVGAIALGLHNPFPHALFAAPFLLRLLRSRRIGWIAYYVAVYGLAALSWYYVMTISHPQVGRGAALQEFGLPAAKWIFVHGMNLSLLMTWQAPAMALFLVAAFFIIRSLKQAERDLMAGLVLTFAFYFAFPATQGHGWGYRYMYSVLGNAALLAASAAAVLSGPTGPVVRRLVVASSLAALFLQLPLRSIQAERFVRPYAKTLDYIATRPADVVLVDPNAAYYGRDLIRNDPLSKTKPVTLDVTALTVTELQTLWRRHPGRVQFVTKDDMQRLGLPTFGSGQVWVRR